MVDVGTALVSQYACPPREGLWGSLLACAGRVAAVGAAARVDLYDVGGGVSAAGAAGGGRIGCVELFDGDGAPMDLRGLALLAGGSLAVVGVAERGLVGASRATAAEDPTTRALSLAAARRALCESPSLPSPTFSFPPTQ